MTIAEYMKQAQELDNQTTSKTGKPISELMAESVSIWSNDSCRGYFILAAQAAGLDRETIRKVLGETYHLFDEKTLTEAEQAYKDF